MKFIKDNSFKTLGIITLLILALAILILWPLAIIFALNTLFPTLAIASGFWQLLSVLILTSTFAPQKSFYKRD